MPIIFLLPGYLQAFAGGRCKLEVNGSCSTVGEALVELAALYPGVHDRVVTEDGKIRPHVNLFVDEENVRYSGGLAATVREGSELVILPAVSGG